MRSALAGLVLSMGIMAGAVAATAQQGIEPETGGSAAFNQAVDEYFTQIYFKYAPTQGTLAGLHAYDGQLENFSRAAIDQQIQDLHGFADRMAKVERPSDLRAAGDYDLVVANIQSQLLALEKVRGWEKNPDNYSSGITSSAFSLMERKFASPDDRLRMLVAREKLMPAVLQAAHVNLKNPPRIYTEIALEQMPGADQLLSIGCAGGFQGGAGCRVEKAVRRQQWRGDRGVAGL